MGLAGPSGFGSSSTAEDVMDSCLSLRLITSLDPHLNLRFRYFGGDVRDQSGGETARVLAKRGVRVVLPARSLKAAEEAKARIVAEAPTAEVIALRLDLSSLISVRPFASRFLSLSASHFSGRARDDVRH